MLFGMTQDQIMNLVRQFLMIFGTLATSLGWLTPDKVASWTATILSLVGPVSMMASLVWGLARNTQTAIVASAATLVDPNGTPLVKKIEVNPLAQGATSIAAPGTTPPNVVVGSTSL